MRACTEFHSPYSPRTSVSTVLDELKHEAECDALEWLPAKELSDPVGDRDREDGLHNRPRDRDPTDLRQVTERELDADGEHQQDDTDVGGL